MLTVDSNLDLIKKMKITSGNKKLHSFPILFVFIVAGERSNIMEVVFLFSPQASQYHGMGKRLYETVPEFAAALDTVEEIHHKLTGKSLQARMWDPSAVFEDPEISCPGIFGIQVAMVQLLKEFGIQPSIVLGHSFGEYAAAVTSGVLSIEGGMKLVVERAKLLKSKVVRGCFTALKANFEKVTQLIADFEKLNGAGSGPEIAVINAPESVGVGDTFERIEAFERYCDSTGVQYRRLEGSVPYAYHMSHMDPILEDLDTIAATVPHFPPKMTYISSSTGQEMAEVTPKYWAVLTRNRIHFAKAIHLVTQKNRILIEIGPTPRLKNLIARNFEANPPKVFYFTEESVDEVESLLNCLRSLSANGLKVNWNPWLLANAGNGPANFYFQASSPGNLSREIQTDADVLDAAEVEVDITFCSLNYKDKGMLDAGNGGKLGFDFSGIVRNVGSAVTTVVPDDRVYGMCLDGGALASRLKVCQEMLAKVPPTLTLPTAASVPLSYTIAWHALVGLAGLKPSGGAEPARILVNLSRGWIGIPLIQISRLFGAEVFALSGSQERTEYVRSAGVKHIYDLTSCMDFASEIMRDTKGQGLTVVVNNFEVEYLKKPSLNLCSENGMFVDIAPAGHWTQDYVHSLRPDVTYSVLNFSTAAKGQMTQIWRELVPKFESGAFRSIPSKSFPVDSINEVFALFADGKLGMAKPLIQISPTPKT